MKHLSSISGVILLFCIAVTAAWQAIVPGSVYAEEESLLDIFEEINSESLSEASGLRLRIEGVANNLGRIVVIVFDNARAYANYDSTQAVGYAVIKASKGSLEKSFPELTEGPYAIFLFHDENNDYELNTKRGFPIEAYGYSGASDRTTVPSFEKAAIAFDVATVELVYLHCTAFRPSPSCLGRGTD